MKNSYAIPVHLKSWEGPFVQPDEVPRKTLPALIVLRSFGGHTVINERVDKVLVYAYYTNRSSVSQGERMHRPISLILDTKKGQLMLFTTVHLSVTEPAEGVAIGADVWSTDQYGSRHIRQRVFSFGARLTRLRMVEELEK